MIVSFDCAETEKLFNDESSVRFRAIERIARRKLVMLNQAQSLNDIAALPGNRLHKLAGDLAGQYAIRVNDQFRICFTWKAPNAANVKIVDYH